MTPPLIKSCHIRKAGIILIDKIPVDICFRQCRVTIKNDIFVM